MSETTQAPSTPIEDHKATPDPINPAVKICCQAYERAHKAATRKSASKLYAADQAQKAFCKAMPTLNGPESIHDFIACVAYGMLIKAIAGSDGSRLLYAAQVALAAAGPRPRKRRRNAPSKNAKVPNESASNSTVFSRMDT